MAYLIAAANGNWTASSTWQVVDATSLLDAQTGYFTLATAPTWSAGQAFTPGAITIDGIAVKVATRADTPSGTVSVRLFNVTGASAVAGTTVTIDVADLPNEEGTPSSTFDGCSVGWVFFRFGGPVTLAAATNYRVEAQTSAASQVALFRNATADNMARMLRTTTAAAPAAGDALFILGEWTAAGTVTSRTVTMDSTTATDYGTGSTSLASLGVGVGGTLAYGTAGATDYVLRLSGLLQIWRGGTCTIGTPGIPVPRDSSAVLEFDCAATGDFGAIVWGTLQVAGQSPTATKDVIYTRLTATASAGATTLSVGDDTGWKAGHEIFVATTTRTNTQTELATLGADAGASALSLTAGLAATHEGDVANDLRAEVGLLSGHVFIRSTLSTAGCYVRCSGSSSVTIRWCVFRYVSGTANGKRGLEVRNTGGSVTLEYCVARDQLPWADGGIFIDSTTSSTVMLRHIVAYTAAAAGTSDGFLTINSTNTAPVTIEDLVSAFDTTGSTGNMRLFGSGAVTLRRIYLIGASSSPALNCGLSTGTLLDADTIHLHASSSSGNAMLDIVGTSPALRAPIRNLHIWRAGIYGMRVSTGPTDLIFEASRFVGCLSGGVFLDSVSARLTFRGCRFAGQSGYTQPYGVEWNSGAHSADLRLEGCLFGAAAGGAYTDHSTADLGGTTFQAPASVIAVNTIFGSATRFESAWLAGFSGYSFIAEQRRDGVSGDHQITYPAVGTVSRETTVFRTAAPSERLSPSATTWRLRSSVKRIPIDAGQTATIGVWVRKSAAYTGNPPRLVLKANPAVGISTDTVLDTMAGGADTWEQLTGTSSPAATEPGVLEVYVDCDGTAGAVYVDDWTAAVS